MAIYVTGDVHGRAEYGSSRFAFKNWPLGRTLTRDDVLTLPIVETRGFSVLRGLPSGTDTVL